MNGILETVLMGKQKKSGAGNLRNDGPAVQSSGEAQKKAKDPPTIGVKVPLVFKEKLQKIAEAHDEDMGQIIAREMRVFIDREYPGAVRLLKERADQLLAQVEREKQNRPTQ